MRGRWAIALGLAVTVGGWPASPAAHRLDEYLQAARIGVNRDRIDLEIDVTPGAAIASSIVTSIDTDHDGQVSDGERDAYARMVMRGLTLLNDGKVTTLSLTETRVDPVTELLAGTGAIRLRAAASLPTSTAGRHVLAFSNAHRPESSVYLLNALQPDDPGITIRTQRRDPLQREISIDYDIAYGAWPRTLALMGGFVSVAVIVLARRRREVAGKAQRSATPGGMA
jgi:hypothetical protein